MEQSAASAPTPLPDHALAPKRKRILLKWSLIVTLLVFGYFAWQCGAGMHAAAALSDDSVRRFHSQLDAAGYEDIVRDSDKAFQEADSHEELLKFLAGVHSKLGKSGNFARGAIFVNANTNGTFIRVNYNSEFQRGTAVETFTWRKGDGTLRLVGYHVESKVFFNQ